MVSANTTRVTPVWTRPGFSESLPEFPQVSSCFPNGRRTESHEFNTTDGVKLGRFQCMISSQLAHP